MGRTLRQQLVDRGMRALQVASGQRRFVPMWARLQRYVANMELAGFDLASGEEMPPPAIPDQVLPTLYGGVWDNLHQRWDPDALVPEQPEHIQVFPTYDAQVPLITFDQPPIMRVLMVGGPGSGKTRTLSLASLFQGGGILRRRSHLTWGMVGATGERVRDVLWKDLVCNAENPNERGVIPPEWVLDQAIPNKHGSGGMVLLHNRCHFEFVGGKEPSKREGTKIQGRSWDGGSADESQNLHDRVQMDIDERGRRAGRRYIVFETATRLGIGHFEMRLERYKSSKFHHVARLDPRLNPFIDPLYWERFKAFYSENEYRRRVLAEDVPPEQLVYASFLFNENIRPAPRDPQLDVTREITKSRFNHRIGFSWIAGTDFGTLTTVTIWLKAFRNLKYGDLDWWAMRETTSGSHTHAGQHARKLVGFAHPADFIVVADPGINTKDVDKSDYELTRREGVTIRPAHYEPIRVKHRVAMLNALFCDASGRRRLFIDCDNNRAPACPRLVQSLLTQQYDDRGNPENVRKDYSDPTHWPAGLAFGLYSHEQLRGQTTFDVITGGVNGPGEDPLLVKARTIAARRQGLLP